MLILTCGSLFQEIMKANQLGSMLSMAKRSKANLKVNIVSSFLVFFIMKSVGSCFVNSEYIMSLGIGEVVKKVIMTQGFLGSDTLINH